MSAAASSTVQPPSTDVAHMGVGCNRRADTHSSENVLLLYKSSCCLNEDCCIHAHVPRYVRSKVQWSHLNERTVISYGTEKVKVVVFPKMACLHL